MTPLKAPPPPGPGLQNLAQVAPVSSSRCRRRRRARPLARRTRRTPEFGYTPGPEVGTRRNSTGTEFCRRCVPARATTRALACRRAAGCRRSRHFRARARREGAACRLLCGARVRVRFPSEASPRPGASPPPAHTRGPRGSNEEPSRSDHRLARRRWLRREAGRGRHRHPGAAGLELRTGRHQGPGRWRRGHLRVQRRDWRHRRRRPERGGNERAAGRQLRRRRR